MMLGHIKGQLEGIEKKVDDNAVMTSKINTRLHKVETKSAIFGAGAGGAMGVGLTLIVETIKHKTGMGGS